mgnify:CR=1 FL=1
MKQKQKQELLIMTNNITTFSYFSEEEYEKLKQITKTLKEENTKASQSMLIRVAFNELINNKTLKQINDLIKKQQIEEIYK